jgi:hypothetical protein
VLGTSIKLRRQHTGNLLSAVPRDRPRVARGTALSMSVRGGGEPSAAVHGSLGLRTRPSKKMSKVKKRWMRLKYAVRIMGLLRDRRAELELIKSRAQAAAEARGIVYEVGSIDDARVVPVWQQGNLELYEKDALLQRKFNRDADAVIAAIGEWWDLASRNVLSGRAADGLVHMDEYLAINNKIYRALVNPFDADDAAESAIEDWERDCPAGQDYMDYEHFFASFFELADNYTDTLDPDDYAAFLLMLFESITVEDGRGGRTWASDYQIPPPDPDPDVDAALRTVRFTDLHEAIENHSVAEVTRLVHKFTAGRAATANPRRPTIRTAEDDGNDGSTGAGKGGQSRGNKDAGNKGAGNRGAGKGTGSGSGGGSSKDRSAAAADDDAQQPSRVSRSRSQQHLDKLQEERREQLTARRPRKQYPGFPLHFCARVGTVEIALILLLQLGADPDLLDLNKRRARDVAKLHGRAEIAELLNNLAGDGFDSPSWRLALIGDLVPLRILLGLGRFNLDGRDQTGGTLLHATVRRAAAKAGTQARANAAAAAAAAAADAPRAARRGGSSAKHGGSSSTNHREIDAGGTTGGAAVDPVVDPVAAAIMLAEMLVDAGCNVRATDRAGKTAYELGLEGGAPDEILEVVRPDVSHEHVKRTASGLPGRVGDGGPGQTFFASVTRTSRHLKVTVEGSWPTPPIAIRINGRDYGCESAQDSQDGDIGSLIKVNGASASVTIGSWPPRPASLRRQEVAAVTSRGACGPTVPIFRDAPVIEGVSVVCGEPAAAAATAAAPAAAAAAAADQAGDSATPAFFWVIRGKHLFGRDAVVSLNGTDLPRLGVEFPASVPHPRDGYVRIPCPPGPPTYAMVKVALTVDGIGSNRFSFKDVRVAGKRALPENLRLPAVRTASDRAEATRVAAGRNLSGNNSAASASITAGRVNVELPQYVSKQSARRSQSSLIAKPKPPPQGAARRSGSISPATRRRPLKKAAK